MSARYTSPADPRREIVARQWYEGLRLSSPWDCLDVTRATTAGEILRWMRAEGLTRTDGSCCYDGSTSVRIARDLARWVREHDESPDWSTLPSPHPGGDDE